MVFFIVMAFLLPIGCSCPTSSICLSLFGLKSVLQYSWIFNLKNYRNVKITLCRYLLILIVPLICLFLITCVGSYAIKKPLMNNSINFSKFSIDFDDIIKFAAFEMNAGINNFFFKSIIQIQEFANKMMILIIAFNYFLSYSIIIFCGQRMVKYVAANAMHERLRELNKQLTKSLIIIVSSTK